MIIYKNGDLFSTSSNHLVQGCNNQGKMNAGIAQQFKMYFPEMFQDYKKKCRKNLLEPGSCYLFQNQRTPHVINVITQSDGQAQEQYLELGFRSLNYLCQKLDIHQLAMPRIGTGLGGLEWNVVKDILKKNFEENSIELEIWTH